MTNSYMLTRNGMVYVFYPKGAVCSIKEWIKSSYDHEDCDRVVEIYIQNAREFWLELEDRGFKVCPV
jgi:hypothetical protein